MKDDSTLKLFKVLKLMDSSCRFSRDPITVPESVLKHSGWVALWSFFTAKRLEKQFGEGIIDYGMLLTKALCHDLDEVGTGDIPRITKHANKNVNRELNILADKSVTWLSKFVDIDLDNTNEDLNSIWKDAKDLNSGRVEDYIVYLADISAVCYTVWEEVVLKGNKSYLRVAKEIFEVIGRKAVFSGKILNKQGVYINPKQHLGKLSMEMSRLIEAIIREYDDPRAVLPSPSI